MELEMSTKSTSQLQLPTESEEPQASKKELVNRLEKFGDNSSFSAAVYEFKSKSIIKRLLWALIIIVAIGGFCYITYESINMLVQEPIATSIVESTESELEFPAVTVCSLSFLNTTVLNEFEVANGYNLSGNLQSLFDYAEPPSNLMECKSVADEIASQTKRDIGFGTLINNVAQNDPRRLVINCRFQGQDCIEDLIPINTLSGVCFTFNGPNSGKRRAVQGTGVRQGLRITVRNGNQLFSLNSNHGYNVIVHNRDEPPRPESEGVVVGLRSNLYVAMRHVTSVDKTKFFSGQNCTRQSQYASGNLGFTDYSLYSPSLCLNDCFYSHIADRCKCIERDFYTPSRSPYTEMRNCTATDICCEVNAFSTYEDNCDCPLKCETVSRTITASSATHSFEDRVGINVYYESLVAEVRETTDSYTPWSLISDIGGNTGLFLGFTLLTVGEVVLLVGALCTDLCCSVCKKKMKERWANSEKV